jgi:hypothetical protein
MAREAFLEQINLISLHRDWGEYKYRNLATLREGELLGMVSFSAVSSVMQYRDGWGPIDTVLVYPLAPPVRGGQHYYYSYSSIPTTSPMGPPFEASTRHSVLDSHGKLRQSFPAKTIQVLPMTRTQKDKIEEDKRGI